MFPLGIKAEVYAYRITLRGRDDSTYFAIYVSPALNSSSP
jgi:hypothetical protein